ncbi:uncharacterized protein PHACADRAFT_54985, partial [Phanerochaete carnosa HHB-10118-sp]
EIGGPMACMYLLDHPDHYTSHLFQRFYWRSYVNEVKKAWEPALSGEEGKKNQSEDQKIVIANNGGKVIGVNTVMDYMYRPEKYESLCLYDWVRRLVKGKMSK